MSLSRFSMAILSTTVLVGGCQSAPFGQAGDQQGEPSRESPAEVRQERGDQADPGSTYKAQRLHMAMRGLVYETGRVEVDPTEASRLVGRPSAAAAAIERDHGLRQLLDSNDPITAIATLTRAVINDPADARSYEALGRALMFKGESPAAEAAFRTALDLDPAFAEAGFQLGSMLQMTGRPAEAIDQWLNVVKVDPNHGQTHSRLAIELYYAGRYDQAWRHLHEAQRLGAIVPPQFLPLLSAQAAEPVRN